MWQVHPIANGNFIHSSNVSKNKNKSIRKYTNEFDRKIFFLSCENGDLKYIKYCCNEFGNIAIRDNFNRNPFHHVVWSGNNNSNNSNNSNNNSNNGQRKAKKIKALKYLLDSMYFEADNYQIGLQMLNGRDIYNLR